MFDKGVCSHSDIPGLNFIYLLNPFSDNGTACFLSSVSIQLIPPIIFMYTPGGPHFEVHSITTRRIFFLRVRGPLFPTPKDFRNLPSCLEKSDTSQFFLNWNCLGFFFLSHYTDKLVKLCRFYPDTRSDENYCARYSPVSTNEANKTAAGPPDLTIQLSTGPAPTPVLHHPLLQIPTSVMNGMLR